MSSKPRSESDKLRIKLVRRINAYAAARTAAWVRDREQDHAMTASECQDIEDELETRRAQLNHALDDLFERAFPAPKNEAG
jgi:hypothetical protein